MGEVSDDESWVLPGRPDGDEEPRTPLAGCPDFVSGEGSGRREGSAGFCSLRPQRDRERQQQGQLDRERPGPGREGTSGAGKVSEAD